MSFTVFIISLIFAIIEAGLSWLLLGVPAISGVFSGLPLWVLTGIIFGVGMLLTFIVIIIVGSMDISDRAASFVRDHFGRTIALAICSIIAVLAVSIGGEMLYQANPLPKRQKAVTHTDICFVLDCSSSMSWDNDGYITSDPAVQRGAAMKRAFAEAVNVMSPGQRISVIQYQGSASLLYEWNDITSQSQAEVIQLVDAMDYSGGTNFNAALQMADKQAEKAIAAGRGISIVMISDGDDPSFSSVRANAPVIIDNGIQIHTICVINGTIYESNLHEISDETGGTALATGSDVSNLSQMMVETTQNASVTTETEDTSIPDTLLTNRYVSRKTIINARVLRIIILFLLAFWFKFIAIICIGNNDSNLGTHLLHAFLVAIIGALAVEFGYGIGLPALLLISIFWILMITQVVRMDR